MDKKDLENLALSRISEPLSKGKNIKKLLKIHVHPYKEQITQANIIENLKNIDNASSLYLEWFGILKGVLRPKTTINNEELNQFFNVYDTKLSFSEDDITKPLYFNQLNYFKVGDTEFKRIIKAFCNLTNFVGTIDEYSYFFKEIFKIDIVIKLIDGNLHFYIEDYNSLFVDDILIKELTPELSQTKNIFYKSPYTLFSLDFSSIRGTNLDFGGSKTSSLYFPL